VTTETRYFKNASINNNELACNDLGIAQTSSATYFELTLANSYSGQLGIRVWKRSSAGVETEITAGSPVAVMEKAMGTSGIDSATWSCPETSLVSDDSIVVRVYLKRMGYPPYNNWELAGTWQTEDLSANLLAAAVWTVYYYWQFYYGSQYRWRFWWGSSSYDSRIANFQYNPVETQYINVTDNGLAVETVTVLETEYVNLTENVLGSELITTEDWFSVTDTGLGTDIVYLLGEVLIDGLKLEHALRITVSEPTNIASKPVSEGLPSRPYLGKQGRSIEIEGWVPTIAELNIVEVLADGAAHEIQLPTGTRISVHIVEANPNRSASTPNHYVYNIRAVERMD
jgi:hypothetical protein